MGVFDNCKPANACTSGLSWTVILDKCVTPNVKSVLTVFPSCDGNETPIIFPYPNAGRRGS